MDGRSGAVPASEQRAGEKPTNLRPWTFELAALTTLQPRLFELPLTLHGGRGTLGARVHTSEYFSCAPQLLLEHYRGSTPNGLAVTSTDAGLLLDVSLALPWLHWELLVGHGWASMQRATTDSDMSRQHDVVGISVRAEYRINDDAHVFALLGERWLGQIETTVLGLGFRK